MVDNKEAIDRYIRRASERFITDFVEHNIRSAIPYIEEDALR